MSDSALDPRPFDQRPEHWHYGRCGWQRDFIWGERVAMSELGIGPDEVRQNKEKRVSFVSLRGRTISDDRLVHLKAFEFLDTVDLVGSTVTGACLVYLQEIPNLKWLWIADTKISEHGARRLEQAIPDLTVFRKGEGATKNAFGSWIKIKRGWWPSTKP
jgi:hypothetical protein